MPQRGGRDALSDAVRAGPLPQLAAEPTELPRSENDPALQRRELSACDLSWTYSSYRGTPIVLLTTLSDSSKNSQPKNQTPTRCYQRDYHITGQRGKSSRLEAIVACPFASVPDPFSWRRILTFGNHLIRALREGQGCRNRKILHRVCSLTPSFWLPSHVTCGRSTPT
jgi:hypothetical protein